MTENKKYSYNLSAPSPPSKKKIFQDNIGYKKTLNCKLPLCNYSPSRCINWSWPAGTFLPLEKHFGAFLASLFCNLPVQHLPHPIQLGTSPWKRVDSKTDPRKIAGLCIRLLRDSMLFHYQYR